MMLESAVFANRSSNGVCGGMPVCGKDVGPTAQNGTVHQALR